MSGVVVLALVCGAAFGVQAFRVAHALRGVQHFEAAPGKTTGTNQPGLVLAPPLKGVVTFLVFTTGSHGMTQADARRYHIGGLQNRGDDDLTDTIMLVVVDTGASQIRYLSVPRDTWVPEYHSKINALYVDHGVRALVTQVQAVTGVPINHVVALGFTAFGRFTDAADGVDIEVPVPTRDKKSGLLLEKVGCTHMDGRTALAFARSRHTQVDTGSGWHTDPGAGDFQRVTRQQVIADAFVHNLLTPKLPLMAPHLAKAIADEVTIDKDLTIGSVISTAAALAKNGGISTRHYVLPSRNGRIGDAAVTFVQRSTAPEVLTSFGDGVPGFELPTTYPRRTPSSGESPAPAPAPTATRSGDEVMPDGITLTSTSRYRVC